MTSADPLAKSAARRGALHLSVRLMRLLSVLVALQLGGYADMGRALGWFGNDTDCCDTCPNDAEGKRCPPDCPKCHCSSARTVAIRQQTSVTVAAAAPRADEAPRFPVDTDAPKAPYPPAIYRPPRSPATPA